ncbi:hypothetical protein SLEP1_g9846 [Rubroshorea leprosula]|uniref:Uncharacterized protein n=1 Tax=Rubroshorea leprosula TaxID=152421 RepID=A0AAV5IE55_9ROSI|nr:hypothetical protein SLEP1_g9846 [Rubroshorea leprosula]
MWHFCVKMDAEMDKLPGQESQESITTFEKSSHLDVDYHFAFQWTPVSEKKQRAVLSGFPSMLQFINLYGYFSQKPTSNFSLKTPKPDTHYLLKQTDDQEQPQFEEEEEKEEQEKEESEQIQEQSFNEVYSNLKQNHIMRAKYDTEPTSKEIRTKLAGRMSQRARSLHLCILRKKSLLSLGGWQPEEVDDKVNSKADDFINRFNNQLTLQRIDSIVSFHPTGPPWSIMPTLAELDKEAMLDEFQIFKE